MIERLLMIIKPFHLILALGIFVGISNGIYDHLNWLTVFYTVGLLYLVYLKRIHDCVHIWQWTYKDNGDAFRRCSRCWKIDSILQVDKNAVFYRPLSLINDTPLSARSWTPISDNMIVDGDQLKGNFSVINKTGGTQKVEISFKLVRRYLSKFDYMYSIILEDTWQQKIPDGYSLEKAPTSANTIELYRDGEHIKELTPLYRLTWENEEHRKALISGNLCIGLGNSSHFFRL